MTTSDDVMLPLAAAAKFTGVSYATVYGAGLRGLLRLRRMGGRIFVPLRDLEEFRSKRGVQGPVQGTQEQPAP